METPHDPEERAEEPYPEKVDADVPETDALEQAQPWEKAADDLPREIPLDVPEADALDQARDATPGDDERDR